MGRIWTEVVPFGGPGSEARYLELPVEVLLERARPLPSHDDMMIEDLDEIEGAGFLAALQE